MKFNEKLIELRRKEGLSQEELGEKLNVTRQTVSKWELGQTTPEMDKLMELSKIFNVSIDELINSSEPQINETTQIEDEPIINSENNKREKNIKTVIIVILIIVIILIAVKFIQFNKAKNQQQNMFKNIFNTASNIIDRTVDNIEQKNNEINNDTKEINNNTIETNETDDEINNMYNQFKEEENNRKNKRDISDFNFYFSNMNGTTSGFLVKTDLDKLITSNKTKDRKITFKYNEIETQDPEIIKETKKRFDTSKDYEISIDYDEDGYVNLITVEDL